MRGFLGAFAEQDAVVADDADGIAPDVGKAGDKRVAIKSFEFVEARAVDGACDNFADVERFSEIARDDSREFFLIVQRFFGRDAIDQTRAVRSRFAIEIGDDVASNFERVLVVVGEVVGHAGGTAVDFAATEFLGRDDFTGRGFHEGGPPRKIVP